MDSDNGFKAFDTQRFLAVVKKLAENDRLFNAENLAQEFVKRGNQQNAREVTANLQRQTGVDLQGFLGNMQQFEVYQHEETNEYVIERTMFRNDEVIDFNQSEAMNAEQAQTLWKMYTVH